MYLLKDGDTRHIALGSDAVARLKPKLMMYPEQCVHNWAALWEELLIFGFHECRFIRMFEVVCVRQQMFFSILPSTYFVSLCLQEITDSNV
jgi:hypothetical protein